MDIKQVIIDFRYISAYEALKNIIEQCGIDTVLQSIKEITLDESLPNTIDEINLPKECPIKFGSFNDYGSIIGIRLIDKSVDPRENYD